LGLQLVYDYRSADNCTFAPGGSTPLFLYRLDFRFGYVLGEPFIKSASPVTKNFILNSPQASPSSAKFTEQRLI
jgi:hypothetical protein